MLTQTSRNSGLNKMEVSSFLLSQLGLKMVQGPDGDPHSIRGPGTPASGFPRGSGREDKFFPKEGTRRKSLTSRFTSAHLPMGQSTVAREAGKCGFTTRASIAL